MNITKKNYKIYAEPWPHLVVENFLNSQEAVKFKNEILNFKNFDDKVMVNRNRVNKGTDNFENLVQKTKYIKKFYQLMNDEKFYKNVRNLFKKIKLRWVPNDQYHTFSKNFFGEQKFSFKEKFIKLLSYFGFIKTSMNLDMDFSVSSKGYYRAAHRDRDTRVINFLLYLNNIPANSGGALEIHEPNFNKNFQDEYPRFPKKNQVKFVKKIKPKSGRLVVFLSTPNSYHAAEKITKKLNRVFVYGSYSLNKKVNWKKSIK